MKFLIFLMFSIYCSSVNAEDPMSSQQAHEEAEKKIENSDIDKLKGLPNETIITWALCPSPELGKEEIIKLVNAQSKSESLTIEGKWTSGTFRLQEGQKHIALLWADDVDGESQAKDRSDNNSVEMGYFKDGEKLLLEKGKWNGHQFEYTYRWPGDKEKGKSIKLTLDLVVKDTSSDIGRFLAGFIDQLKAPHQQKKSHKQSPPPPAQSSPVFAQQQPTTVVQQQPPTVVYQQSPVVVPGPYYGPYYGPPVIGVWGGYGHHHWR